MAMTAAELVSDRVGVGSPVRIIRVRDQGGELVGKIGYIDSYRTGEHLPYCVKFPFHSVCLHQGGLMRLIPPGTFDDGKHYYWFAREDFEVLTTTTTMTASTKEVKMMDRLSGYFNKHQETIFTLGAVLLVDYFLFGGALRKKVQDVVEKMVTKCEKAVDGDAK